MGKRNPKTAAVVTIFKPNGMTPEGRVRIAEWLRAQAKNLIKDGKQYANRFTARYIYK